jgi:hypothetical protein
MPALCRRDLYGVMLVVLSAAVQAQPCANAIACENLLPGDAGWNIEGAGDTNIQGFAPDISVNAGQTVFFKVNTDASSYRLDIYRLGFYGGNGGRKITSVNPSALLPQMQPECLRDPNTKLTDCGNWAVSASWHVPSTAVSGIYLALLVRTDTGGTSQVVFIVRNDANRSDILFKTSDETWQAYNYYGGNSLYGGNGTWDLSDRALRVSYNRPFYTRLLEKNAWLFGGEYAMARWLEANGYNVSYFTGVDAARNGSLMLNHKVLLSVGLDEYVSGAQRVNLEIARDAGVNLAFFGGSHGFWKTKWENSIDGTNTRFRTLTCYKETLNGGSPNSADPLTWTGTWRDPRFSPPSDGGYPENSLAGSLFMVNASSEMDLAIEVTAADGRMRFWRNTSIATLAEGETATLPNGTLSYKWDVDLDNGFRPAGLVPVSTTVHRFTHELLQDYGATYGAGIGIHRMGLYRAASGSLVFGAGAVRWPWGLDANHDDYGFDPDMRMQQATVNVLADMDAQPTTLNPRLSLAMKSPDFTPPTSSITSIANVHYGVNTTITGTATDRDGGVVGAVEISLDNGRTWHQATGRENWKYDWTPAGPATARVRASDDSGNLQLTPTTVEFNVLENTRMWSDSTTPGTLQHNDTAAVEVGMKFRSDVAGFITGVRFYKGPNNTGTHVGNLWTSNGTRLASVTFTNETSSGWQQVTFPSAVSIAPNTTYVVSYYAPNGAYAANANFFETGLDRAPLHALADGVDGPNGVYIYAVGGGFPFQSFKATNYWVDPIFTPALMPHSVSLSWDASTTPNIRGYNVYRATMSGGAYLILNNSPIVETAYVDNNVAVGQTYYYVTTAVDQYDNESSYSNEATAILPTP